jgi:hypothetical protein
VNRMHSERQTRKSAYDLAIAYRIYPKVAEPAHGLPFSEDKFKLSEVCLESFKKSLGNLRVKLWVLLDGCPTAYADLFKRYFEDHELVLVPLDGVGNQRTFSKQIELLCTQTYSEIVYFAEDDYLYLPGQFSSMINFLLEHEDVDFVSPYDHPDCYTLDLHRQPKWLKVHGGRHWRTAASTCLTFLTKQQTLRKVEAIFRSYERRNFDCSLWLSLTKRRVFNPWFFARQLIQAPPIFKIILKSWIYCWRQILFGRTWRLWIPVPGIATHLDSKGLSPNVDWRALMEQARRQTMVAIANAAEPRRRAVLLGRSS